MKWIYKVFGYYTLASTNIVTQLKVWNIVFNIKDSMFSENIVTTSTWFIFLWTFWLIRGLNVNLSTLMCGHRISFYQKLSLHAHANIMDKYDE